MAGAEKIRIFNFGASVLVLKCRKPSKNCTNACKNFKENVLYYKLSLVGKFGIIYNFPPSVSSCMGYLNRILL